MKRQAPKLLLFLVGLLLFSLLFTACNEEAQEDETLRALTEDMVEFLLADDGEGAYALIREVCTEEEFTEAYDKMRELLVGVDSFALTLTSIRTTSSDGMTYRQAEYRMTTNGESYLITVSSSEQYANLSGFLLARESDTKPASGTLSTLGHSNFPQWLLLVLALAETAFLLWAVIDCARHKVNGKALWILVILLGCASLYFTVNQHDLSFQLQIGLFTEYTALIRYRSDLLVVRVMLPIGAVVYTCLRKKLFASYTAAPPTQNPYIGTYDESASLHADKDEQEAQNDLPMQPTVDKNEDQTPNDREET